MMNILNRIHSLFIKPQFFYGYITNPDGTRRDGKYRLNNYTGDVEFVLWRAGHNGRKCDYWHRMGYGWKRYFVKFERGDK